MAAPIVGALFSVNLTTAGTTAVYTVPAGRKAVITTLSFANNTGTTAALSYWLTRGGIAYDITNGTGNIASGANYTAKDRIALGAGDTLNIYLNTTLTGSGMSVIGFGEESDVVAPAPNGTAPVFGPLIYQRMTTAGTINAYTLAAGRRAVLSMLNILNNTSITVNVSVAIVKSTGTFYLYNYSPMAAQSRLTMSGVALNPNDTVQTYIAQTLGSGAVSFLGTGEESDIPPY